MQQRQQQHAPGEAEYWDSKACSLLPTNVVAAATTTAIAIPQ